MRITRDRVLFTETLPKVSLLFNLLFKITVELTLFVELTFEYFYTQGANHARSYCVYREILQSQPMIQFTIQIHCRVDLLFKITVELTLSVELTLFSELSLFVELTLENFCTQGANYAGSWSVYRACGPHAD